MARGLDDTLAILNGLVGDYLDRNANGLATEMALYHGAQPIALSQPALAAAHSKLTGRVVVLVHGVMTTERIWLDAGGNDYGQQLADDLGFTPFYVRYNSGRAIADNGASFAKLLADLVAAYPAPIEELLLLGYSMGGLVVRSACHFAALEGASTWLPLVKRVIYVGTPHLGAPAERVGRVVSRVLAAIPDPYTRLIAEIANLRSSGVKDLGDADLRHEDRELQATRVSLRDARHPVPLLPSIQHYLIASALAPQLWPEVSAWFGDSIVPVTSATMHNAELPVDHFKVVPGLSHLELPRSPLVYQQIKHFCEART